ncbi:MAG: LCP family protein [Rhodoluna sp.]|nr:LCP family protein [Rhodoluna sp.]
MRKRAWWLLILGGIFPGTAQILGGNRRLGRFAIRFTLINVGLVALATLVFFINRSWLIGLATVPFITTVLGWYLWFFGALFALVMLDALRLAQLGRIVGRSRWYLLGSFLVVGVLGTSSIVYAGNISTASASAIASIFNQGGGTQPIDGRYNILVLGSDAGSDRFGVRPDSISIFSISAATGKVAVIGIPRGLEKVPFSADSPLWKVYPNGWNCLNECLINAIYKNVMDNHQDLYPDAEKLGSTAGVEATKDAVEGVTGLKISSYVMVEMHAVTKLVDALGGVRLNVKVRLPIGGQADDGSDAREWIEVGDNQLMDGYHALWYARSRHTTSDFDRMRRQKEVQAAILKQVSPAVIFTRFQEVAAVGKSLVTTDIPKDMIPTYLELANKAKKRGLKVLDLVPEKGYHPGNPNYPAIQKAVAKIISKNK